MGKRGLSAHLRFPAAPWVLPASRHACSQRTCTAPGREQPSVGQGHRLVPCSCRDPQAQALGWSLPCAGFPSCGQTALPKAEYTDKYLVFIWKTVCYLFYGKLCSAQMNQATGESPEGRQLCCFHHLFQLKSLVAGRLCACSWEPCDAVGSSEMQMGLLMRVLFFFNRKMTISKNALKLSSKTLSSSTERSECGGGNFFERKNTLFPDFP